MVSSHILKELVNTVKEKHVCVYSIIKISWWLQTNECLYKCNEFFVYIDILRYRSTPGSRIHFESVSEFVQSSYIIKIK